MGINEHLSFKFALELLLPPALDIPEVRTRYNIKHGNRRHPDFKPRCTHMQPSLLGFRYRYVNVSNSL